MRIKKRKICTCFFLSSCFHPVTLALTATEDVTGLTNLPPPPTFGVHVLDVCLYGELYGICKFLPSLQRLQAVVVRVNVPKCILFIFVAWNERLGLTSLVWKPELVAVFLNWSLPMQCHLVMASWDLFHVITHGSQQAASAWLGVGTQDLSADERPTLVVPFASACCQCMLFCCY